VKNCPLCNSNEYLEYTLETSQYAVSVVYQAEAGFDPKQAAVDRQNSR